MYKINFSMNTKRQSTLSGFPLLRIFCVKIPPTTSLWNCGLFFASKFFVLPTGVSNFLQFPTIHLQEAPHPRKNDTKGNSRHPAEFMCPITRAVPDITKEAFPRNMEVL
ncbi:hypothetical protein ISCGN_026237 [Ixodes scapularis]